MTMARGLRMRGSCPSRSCERYRKGGGRLVAGRGRREGGREKGQGAEDEDEGGGGKGEEDMPVDQPALATAVMIMAPVIVMFLYQAPRDCSVQSLIVISMNTSVSYPR